MPFSEARSRLGKSRAVPIGKTLPPILDNNQTDSRRYPDRQYCFFFSLKMHPAVHMAFRAVTMHVERGGGDPMLIPWLWASLAAAVRLGLCVMPHSLKHIIHTHLHIQMPRASRQNPTPPHSGLPFTKNPNAPRPSLKQKKCRFQTECCASHRSMSVVCRQKTS